MIDFLDIQITQLFACFLIFFCVPKTSNTIFSLLETVLEGDTLENKILKNLNLYILSAKKKLLLSLRNIKRIKRLVTTIFMFKKVYVSISRDLTFATNDIHIKLKSRTSAHETGLAKSSS